MIYRALDANGDYTFGRGAANFLVDSREAVGQAVLTRLKLIQGEWFLNIEAGVPYNTKVLGAGTVTKYDAAIQDAIINTTGVTQITAYVSNIDQNTRKATVSCTISTIYGQIQIATIL